MHFSKTKEWGENYLMERTWILLTCSAWRKSKISIIQLSFSNIFESHCHLNLSVFQNVSYRHNSLYFGKGASWGPQKLLPRDRQPKLTHWQLQWTLSMSKSMSSPSLLPSSSSAIRTLLLPCYIPSMFVFNSFIKHLLFSIIVHSF